MNKYPVNYRDAPKMRIKLRDRGEWLTGWTGLQVVRAIDSACDEFSFLLPFDPTEDNFDRFKPYSPGVVEIWGDDEKFLEGYFEHVTVRSADDSRVVELNGRSTTGVLQDWSAGAIYKATSPYYERTRFEFQGSTFNQIAEEVAFPNEVIAVPDTGPLNDVAIDPEQTIFQFLSSLAASNGYFGRPTPAGGLRYLKTLGTTRPVADLQEGKAPVSSIDTIHDVTRRHYLYQVVATESGTPGVQAKAYDTYLSPGIRGSKIIEPVQQSTDYAQTAKFARARALIDSYSVTIQCVGFGYKDASNAWKFWKAGDVIRVLAPGAFIRKPSKLIIEQVSFQLDETGGLRSILQCRLPESYSGNYPSAFPWEAEGTVKLTEPQIQQRETEIVNRSVRDRTPR